MSLEEVMQKDLLNQIEDADGEKRLATGMREVWREAMKRKERLLIVEKKLFISGAIWKPRGHDKTG